MASSITIVVGRAGRIARLLLRLAVALLGLVAVASLAYVLGRRSAQPATSVPGPAGAGDAADTTSETSIAAVTTEEQSAIDSALGLGGGGGAGGGEALRGSSSSSSRPLAGQQQSQAMQEIQKYYHHEEEEKEEKQQQQQQQERVPIPAAAEGGGGGGNVGDGAPTTKTKTASAEVAFSYAAEGAEEEAGTIAAAPAGAIQINAAGAGNTDRPPLKSLLRNGDSQIIGDVQFLLDFAIIGHAKTGTTAQMGWLAKHEQVQMYDHEIHSLKSGKPEELVELMYALEPGDNYRRGYKAPNDILSDVAREALREYWPETKLIVGVRHPVKWFESYYNFNVRKGHDLPPAEQYAGGNLPDKVKFHEHLAMLGKTKLANKHEYGLLGWDKVRTPPVMTNQVFVYDVSQPFDRNRTRAELYSRDLSSFLGLTRPLEPIVIKETPYASRNYHYAIDICDSRYDELRADLLELGTTASAWIGDYFLDLPDVTVSEPEYFRNKILASWLVDPCDAN